MVIKCIDNKGSGDALTVGVEYEVMAYIGERALVKGDNYGRTNWHPRSNFKVEDEDTEEEADGEGKDTEDT